MMTTQTQQQENDKISLIDLLLFLKVSGRNVLLSMVVCLMVGAAYLLATPKIYVASVTIQMAQVAGEVVESPALLLEKIKIPLSYSAATLRACGLAGEVSSQTKFEEKLKPTHNKSAPLISLSARAKSTQEARACLEAVIGEIQKWQDELSKPLIKQKNQKLVNLTEQLKIEELKSKIHRNSMALKNPLEMNTVLLQNLIQATEMNEIRRQIINLETDLIPPRTQANSIFTPINAQEVPDQNRPFFILGLFLALGVVLGLIITGLMRVVPEIRRQMRDNMYRFL